jgi:hypothetical protein
MVLADDDARKRAAAKELEWLFISAKGCGQGTPAAGPVELLDRCLHRANGNQGENSPESHLQIQAPAHKSNSTRDCKVRAASEQPSY